MASLPGTVKQQQAPTDEEKPRIICEIEYFGPEDFSVLPEFELLRKSYFDGLGISSTIRNSAVLTMKKVIENRYEGSEMLVSAVKGEGKQKHINLWQDFGYFGTEPCEFPIEKVNLPENSCLLCQPRVPIYERWQKSLLHRCFYFSSDNATCSPGKRHRKLST